MLEHGGRLRAAALHHGIPLADWLDLSTGISPHAYPLPAPPASLWQRLPEDDDGLEAAAADYYGSAELLPVAGSQAAIQTLPALLAPAPASRRVALLSPSYGEHAHAWRQQHCSYISAAAGTAALDAAAASHDILVLVHPNNPDGRCFSRTQLQRWRQQLAARGGWLVIDEAFIDCDPAASLTPAAGTEGLIVLRSLGKFFGLAGARVGFVFAPRALRQALARLLGPWALSGPARWAATLALADHAWQQAMRQRLSGEGARLQQLLHDRGLPPQGGSALFQYLADARAPALFQACAEQGVLLRLFPPAAGQALPALRFGLPADEAGWQRLATTLATALR